MEKEKHDTENLSIISSEEKFGLDHLWEKLPHISAYQLRITGMASYASVLGGFLAIYPVFAQYTPPHRRQTFFDDNEDFSWLTWKQVEQLTLETPFCGGKNGSKHSFGASCGHCVFDPISIESCDHRGDFSVLRKCLGKSEQEVANWSACKDNFSFDRSVNEKKNVLFDAGQPWQSAVTQFNLVCSDEWFDSLSTALGLLGLMIGAYITVFYVDRRNCF